MLVIVVRVMKVVMVVIGTYRRLSRNVANKISVYTADIPDKQR